MGYVEMIKLTNQGRVAIVLNDGEITQERAFECETCHRYRPESKLMTTWLSNDDWYMECDECKETE